MTTSPVQQNDALKEEITLEYKSRMAEFSVEDQPIHTMDIVKQLSAEYEMSPNGIRMLLQKRGAYIKKSDTPKVAPTDKPKRMSKEAAHTALKDALEAGGVTADEEIISKLSGVAAQYLATSIITIISSKE